MCLPLDDHHLKLNYGSVLKEEKSRRVTLATLVTSSPKHDTNTFIGSPSSSGQKETLRRRSTNTTPSKGGRGPGGGGQQLGGSNWSLAMSPPATPEGKETLVRPKSLVEKARMNVAWLDSSLSIMEQGVKEIDMLLLRFNI